MSEKNPSIWQRVKAAWYIPAIFLVLVAISATLSYFVFGRESLRLDEAQSIWQTSHSLTGMLEVVAQDVHMPFYHILLHYWIATFGNDVYTVRLMSYILFVICVPFVYLLSRTVLSRKWSLFVVALFIFSPFVNWYANEARMYTLLALMSLANQYFFVRIMQARKNSWPWYILTTVVGAYSHYFFFFNLLTQAIFFLVYKKKFPKKTFSKLVGTAIILIAAISPWIYYFISEGAAGNTRPLIELPSAINFFNAYSQFLFGFQNSTINTFLLSLWPLTVIVAFLIVRRFIRPSPQLHFIAFAAFVPPLLAFLLSFLITPFFLPRYMFAVVAPLLIVIVWIISIASKRAAFISIAIALVGTITLAVIQTISSTNPVRESYYQVTQDIERSATPSDVVALSSPFTVYPFEYYYDGPTQVKTLPNWDRKQQGSVPPYNAEQIDDQVNSLKKGHDKIYLLLSYDQGYEENLRNYFANRYELLSQTDYTPSMKLLVYRVGYNDPVSF